MSEILNPFELYFGQDGRPIGAGSLYIGVAGLDPQIHPVDVFYDREMTVPAMQPLNISGGYVWNCCAPTKVFAAPADYSLKVLGKNGEQVFYCQNVEHLDEASRIGYLAPFTGAQLRTQSDKNAESVSIKDFGAIGDGTLHTVAEWIPSRYANLAAVQADYPHVTSTSDSIDWAAVQKSVNAAPTFVPAGSYKINKPIVLPTGFYLRGSHRSKTIFVSDIIGGSLFKTVGNVSYGHLSDMTLQGNGLTDASGNGHALNMIDPQIDVGTHTPQQCVFERLAIIGFAGRDVRDNTATTISACAVIQCDGLQNVYRDILISNSGYGFYFNLAQNTKIENCVVTDCAKFAYFAINNENIVADKCDFINSGDGVTDTGNPAPQLMTGIIGSYANSGFILSNSKLKNTSGKAAIVQYLSNGDVIKENWIRGSMLADVPHKAIYAYRCTSLKITGNTFSPSTTAFTSKKYETIELYNDSLSTVCDAVISNNIFEGVSGFNIAYNIKIGGNANTRPFSGVLIKNNRFGDAQSAAPSVIDADILIGSCLIQNSEISGNTHVASSDITLSSCVTKSAAVFENVLVARNGSYTNGTGIITQKYSGLTDSTLYASFAYNPADMPTGTQLVVTVTVSGATINTGDMTTVGFSSDLIGVQIFGYVSAADTVTVVFDNNTGSVKNVGSGFITVKVDKYISVL